MKTHYYAARLVTLSILASISTAGCAGAGPQVEAPARLRCEYLENPLGIDSQKPRLSWVMKSARRGDRQAAYQVLVASTPELLAQNKGDLWDSGRVESDATIHVVYAGKPLTSRMQCNWKVRLWPALSKVEGDKDGNPTPWSEPAMWSMGLLSEKEWGGQWIGTTTGRHVRDQFFYGAHGYHSAAGSPSPDVTKWVQVDLGKVQPIDEIQLTPADVNGIKGFGFPVRFRIEVSDADDFSNSHVIADHTATDFPDSQDVVQSFPGKGLTGRYVRVTATRLRRPERGYLFALKRIKVLSDGTNVAASCPVTALDSNEVGKWWNRANLTREEPSDYEADLKDAAPLLRKAFDLPPKRIVSATASICGLGYQILYVNGRRAGDSQLDPGWTAFDKRCLYVTYDVTELMRSGRNAIGVMLGNGFYNPTTQDTWFCHEAPWVAPLSLRLNLQVVFADGTKETVVSDGSWKWSTGEVIYQNIRSGETQDKRQAVEGWSRPDFDAAAWKPVIRMPAPKGSLRAQMHPPIRTAGEVPVTEITEPKPGVYVCKMAENISGWTRFTAKGTPGRKITLQHSESLLPDGTVDMQLGCFTFGRWQRNTIILGDSGEGIIEPHFSYAGFHYVQIEGLESPPSKDSLVGVKVHTDLPRIGTFECSSKLINDIHAMMLRTYLNNMHGLPTDCPQREKLGWLCDGFLASEMGMWNYDAAALYEKWIRDMEDDQEADGSLSEIIPSNPWAKPGPRDPLWSGVTVLVPWNLYRMYADTGILDEHFDSMRRYVDYVESMSVDGLIHSPPFNFRGDWVEVDSPNNKSVRTPAAFACNAIWFKCADIVAKSAQVLGRSEEAQAYAALAESIRTAINAKWFDPAQGRYSFEDSQCGPAMALVLGIVPEASRTTTVSSLLESIRRRDGHISTGIVGAYYLFKALEASGNNDVALEIMTKIDPPSYASMLAKGTVYEEWGGRWSQSHPALGGSGFWFYEGIAGIRRAAPGFSKVVIRPGNQQGLTWARASHRTPYGEISSQWKRQDGRFTLNVSIPPNVEADVFVPTQEGAAVTESGKAVNPVRTESGHAVFVVGSGDYVFQSEVSDMAVVLP